MTSTLGRTEMLGHRAPAPQHQDKLENLSDRSLTIFSKDKHRWSRAGKSQCRCSHRSAGWRQHKEAEDPCKWTGRGQQGTLAAARAAHTLGCLSRIAANTLAEMIIPIWMAARHVSGLVSPSTEIAQLERANGKEAAAHHARPEAVRKVKAGSHIILHYTGEQRLQEKSASNSLQRCKGKGQQRKLQLSHLF